MRLTALLALAVLAAPLGRGQQSAGAPPPRTFEFGFEQRVRNENWNNILDYSDQADDEREQIRYRTRVWFKAPLPSDIDVVVGLNQETNQKMGKVNQLDEVIFDTAYLDFKKLFVKGLSLRVGRQNLMKGEGFVLLEGNPGDGSRSIYVNAVDLAYSWKKSKLELIGILDPKKDRFLPRIHDQHKPLQDSDEQALGAYYTDTNHKNLSIEAYYFLKKEIHDTAPYLNPQFVPDRHIHTIGGRLVRKLPRGWSATGEFAGQWGAQHPDVAIRGWGGYSYLKKQFDTRWKPYLLGGWWGFSGDDPKTKGAYEGWDPLFARWPKWSELYLYSEWREIGVGYTTNTSMWQGEAGIAPKKWLAARATWYHMDSFQPSPGSPKIFGTGTGRGENPQVRVDFMPNPNWKAHVLYEAVLPGNFYRVANPGYFLRFEVSYLMTAKLTGSELKQAFGSHPTARAAASPAQ